MMTSRLIVVAALAALVVAGSMPVSGACALAPGIEHACCSERPPEPAASSSCCSSETTQMRSESGGISCECAHPAAAPAATVGDGPPRSDDDPADSASVVADAALGAFAVDSSPTDERARSHPPPPLYLLHSSLLT